MGFFRKTIDARRRVYLALAGQIESGLRDAYDERHRNHGVTQASIADALGIDRSAVNHRLRGLTNMTIQTLADMVWAFGYAIKVVIYDPSKTADNYAAAGSDIPALPDATTAKLNVKGTTAANYAVKLPPLPPHSRPLISAPAVS